MRTLRTVCWLALPAAALVFGLNNAAAQGSPDARQACTPDAMRLCAEFIPDAARVQTCMLSKRSQLSRECRIAMADGHSKHSTHHHKSRRHSRHSS